MTPRLAAIFRALEDRRLPTLCRHCLVYREDHAENDKCLYQPTSFEPFPAAESVQDSAIQHTVHDSYIITLPEEYLT